jgi:hypothetical protein
VGVGKSPTLSYFIQGLAVKAGRTHFTSVVPFRRGDVDDMREAKEEPRED